MRVSPTLLNQNNIIANNKPIWWVDNTDETGVWLFSFDKVKIYNLFADYPHKLSAMERRIFDAENPFWRDFFSDRK